MHVPAWLAPFDPAFAEAVAARLRPGAGRRVAAFDADGTLWSEDIGEAFLRWLAAGGLLPRQGGAAEVWDEYERRVRESRVEGYTWAVQIMAGLREELLRGWCRQLAAAWPNYRPEMADLRAGLEAEGFEIWIVSASNRWIVEAAAPTLGIPAERVLGIEVQVADGLLSPRPVYPRPCGQGKVDAIQKHIGVKPVFAFGDSMGDFEMLGFADQPLVVGRRDRPDNELVRQAAGRGWPVHRF
jgi:HAD superfamily phosphoserine phosphatase-like hydrolase